RFFAFRDFRDQRSRFATRHFHVRDRFDFERAFPGVLHHDLVFHRQRSFAFEFPGTERAARQTLLLDHFEARDRRRRFRFDFVRRFFFPGRFHGRHVLERFREPGDRVRARSLNRFFAFRDFRDQRSRFATRHFHVRDRFDFDRAFPGVLHHDLVFHRQRSFAFEFPGTERAARQTLLLDHFEARDRRRRFRFDFVRRFFFPGRFHGRHVLERFREPGDRVRARSLNRFFAFRDFRDQRSRF